ncbi:MAG TPA: hypothetical protein VGK03_03630 [Geothrix sp.]|jgi:hypothetical protein
MNIIVMGAMMALMLLLFHGRDHHGGNPGRDHHSTATGAPPSGEPRKNQPDRDAEPKAPDPKKDQPSDLVPAPPKVGQP